MSEPKEWAVMTPEEKEQVVNDYPTIFKVCDSCESIVMSNVVICPRCHAYSFNESPADVCARAKIVFSPAYQNQINYKDLLS